MIFRRPFAMLIKNFKVIHIVLTLLMAYTIMKTSAILSFFNEYIASNSTILGEGLVSSLFNYPMFIAIIFIILISIVVFILMKYKKKKSLFYFFVICVYIYNFALYVFAYNNVKILETGLVGIRTLKVIQDLYITLIILQFYTVIMALIRSTGFNIKKFDFGKDIEELNIVDKDNEEFLVNIEFDSNKFKTNLKKNIRHIKYAYKENKLFANLIILVIIALICTGLYYNIGVYNKVYKENESFKSNNLIMSVANTYVTSRNMKNDVIFNNNRLVVVKLNIRGISNDTVLDTSRFYIKKGSERYYVTKDYNNYVKDLGNIYNKEKLNTEFNYYNIVFKIPNDNLKDLYLVYNDSNDKNIRVKLSLEDLDMSFNSNNYNLGDEIVFDSNILNKSKITISEFDKSENYVVNYNFCLDKNTCYNSNEYITPSITSSVEKALIRIKGSYEENEEINNENFSSLEKLLINNAKIVYTINGNNMESYIYKSVKPKKINSDYYYLEIDKNVLYGSDLKLVINIRNQSYIYTLG